MQGGETRRFWQRCWDACSLTAGEEAGLLILGRKQRVTGCLEQMLHFCECAYVCTTRILACFACCGCCSTCGCCLFSAHVSTALFPLTTEYHFLPLSDLQSPPPITYASHFFSQKNNEFYWLFSLFLPTSSAPSLASLPTPGGGNENSNKITNSSVAPSYLLILVLCHDSGSWGEGFKPNQLLGHYIFLHENLITHQFFSCMEVFRGGLNTIFLWLH